MGSSLRFYSGALALSLLIPGTFADVHGQESTRLGASFLCQSGDHLRRVEVHYLNPEMDVPCEVHYFKDSEGPGLAQVLWRAEHEVGFCEDKTTGLVDKLSGFGWDCQLQSDIPPDLQESENPME